MNNSNTASRQEIDSADSKVCEMEEFNQCPYILPTGTKFKYEEMKMESITFSSDEEDESESEQEDLDDGDDDERGVDAVAQLEEAKQCIVEKNIGAAETKPLLIPLPLVEIIDESCGTPSFS